MHTIVDRIAEYVDPADFNRTKVVVPPTEARRHRAEGQRRPWFEIKLHTNLKSAEPAWRALEASGACTAFQRFDWIETIGSRLIDSTRSDWRIVEIVFRQTGATAMILPMAATRRSGFTITEFVTFEVCDYAAPIMARGLTLNAAEMTEIWRAVRAALAPTDIIRVPAIAASNNGIKNPLALLEGAVASPHVAMGMNIQGGENDILARNCSPSFVKKYKESERKLGRIGALTFVEARTPAEVEEFLGSLIAQRRARFTKLGRADLLARPEIAAFYRDAALRGLENGRVRLFAAKVADEMIGHSYTLVQDGVKHGLLLSIDDEKWRKFSPGVFIYGQGIIWAAKNGIKYFDLAVGLPDLKSGIGFQSAPLTEFVEPVTIKGIIVARAHDARAAVIRWLRQRPALYDALRRARQRLRRAQHELSALRG